MRLAGGGENPPKRRLQLFWIPILWLKSPWYPSYSQMLTSISPAETPREAASLRKEAEQLRHEVDQSYSYLELGYDFPKLWNTGGIATKHVAKRC